MSGIGNVADYSETTRLTEGDATDHALATIASILDQPASPPEAAKAVAGEKPEVPLSPETGIEGYSKSGPGPMEAIRFKWTVRRERDDRYFVDETIGDNSQPITNGPMSGDEAVRFVDERESEARQRFERLKIEMAGRAAAANLVRGDDSEI